MKTKQLLFSAVIFTAILFSQRANAKVWRVNNMSNFNGTTLFGDNLGGTDLYPVYKQLSEVNSANIVVSGDTVHLEGSNRVYDGAGINKKLIIIGTGYFLTENPNTSVNGLVSKVYFIIFNTGSTGSQLIGVHVGSHGSGTSINVSNILIKRCRLDYEIYISFNISDITIVENFFSNDAGGTNSILGWHGSGFASNVIINNNIIERTLILPNNAGYTVSECNNNVFAGPSATPAIQIYVGRFQNNILINQNATVILNGIAGPSSNSNISFNVSSLASTQFGTANNNIEANMANVFVNLGAVGDAGYQLKSGSPVSGNGSNGSDRGAFGGANRYVLSGLPPIPVIYEVNTSGVAGPAGLPVTIKAKTIK